MREMNVPPEIKPPDSLPALPCRYRWKKRFERAAIEIGCIFDRESRRRELLEFQKRWLFAEREVRSFRLAVLEFQERYSRSPITNVRAIGLRFLPKEVNERAHIYRLHAAFVEMVEKHRARLGLPPRDASSKPSP